MRVYAAGSRGGVWSAEDLAARCFYEPNTGCLLWGGAANSRGYGLVKTGAFPREQLAHRAAWLFALGEIPPGLCVCHRCDTPPCCNVDHLFLGTRAENNADKENKGRAVTSTGDRNGMRLHPESVRRGEVAAGAKLTVAAVLEIRASRLKRGEIAEQFGISGSLVGQIQRRQAWGHVS